MDKPEYMNIPMNTMRHNFNSLGPYRLNKKLDNRMAILVYWPERYQDRSGVVLYAMLDFAKATDRAVIIAGDEPFAVAESCIREVATPPRS